MSHRSWITPRERLPLAGCLLALATLGTPAWGQADHAKPPAAPSTPAALSTPASALESPLPAIYEAASPDMRAFAQHNLTLSNPFFEGRVPGSHGNRVAADYIEFYYRQAGLKPAFASEVRAADGSTVLTPNGTFRQPFKIGNEITVQQAAVSFDLGGGGIVELQEGPDFTVLGLSGSGSVTAPLVCVGYSITDGQDGYATYTKTTDLSGKIAIILRFEPMTEAGKSQWAAEGWSPAASIDAKIRAASDHHAAGIIVVNPPGAIDVRAQQQLRTQDTKPLGAGETIPVVMATPEFVERLIRVGADGQTLMSLRQAADKGPGIIDLPSAKATLTTRLAVEPVMTDNIGAVLPGKGKLADRYLIIGAHYDHVGFGPVGTQAQNNGKLHPGADDNGSGTSGVLVIADKLAKAYAELPANADAHSILFLAFSAEESGLIGSHYYAGHPSLDLSRADLMLNMDMIGRWRPVNGLEIQGTESAAGLYDWLKPYFDKAADLNIKHGSEVAGNSDHASFYQKKMPVLFFFTGLHREYHTPQDTGFTINQAGAARVIGLVFDIAMGLTKRAEPWKFTPRSDEHDTTPPPADKAAANPPKGTGSVRFGIAPASYSDDKPGIEVGDVYEGTCAADAGIKVGDRMMKWNGQELTDVMVWTTLMRAQKPGDEVDVTVLRDGKEMVIKVKLRARDQGGK